MHPIADFFGNTLSICIALRMTKKEPCLLQGTLKCLLALLRPRKGVKMVPQHMNERIGEFSDQAQLTFPIHPFPAMPA